MYREIKREGKGHKERLKENEIKRERVCVRETMKWSTIDKNNEDVYM